MTTPEIPARVLQFLAERIDTVPQLEALLLLWENPQRQWSEEELAARIYVTDKSRRRSCRPCSGSSWRRLSPWRPCDIGITRNGMLPVK